VGISRGLEYVLEEINPGNQLTGTIVFDIPKPFQLLLKSGV
jgi:hypothetical protein